MADHKNAHHKQADRHDSGHLHHYYRLLAMVVLSFVAMYILMYAMVNSFANVYNNVNQFYMAGLMAAPMALIELALMSSMYRDKRLNIIIGICKHRGIGRLLLSDTATDCRHGQPISQIDDSPSRRRDTDVREVAGSICSDQGAVQEHRLQPRV